MIFVATQIAAACSKNKQLQVSRMVAMMWRVSPAFPGILSVIGFSGSGHVFMSVVTLNTKYVCS